MKIIYPNENIKLTKGGRNSDKITSPEFSDLIRSIHKKLITKSPEASDYNWNCPEWIFVLSDFIPKVSGDLKYEFDFENITIYSTKTVEFNESDIKLTSGGTPYLELYCGGDWEKGLIVYVYPCNNSLRVYIPTKGNNVRKDLKCVFGGESEMYSPTSRLTYLKKYTKENLDGEAFDVKENPEWCLEDFETRLGER